MNFSSVSDRYIYLTYNNNSFEQNISPPLILDADHETYIGLSNFTYLNNLIQFNFPGAVLGVFGSKYTNNRWKSIQFMPGSYNAVTLCEEINQRFKSIFPSSFNNV